MCARVQTLIDQLHTATYLSFFQDQQRVFTQSYEMYQAMLHPVNSSGLLDELIESLRLTPRGEWQTALDALVESWRSAPYPDVQFYAKLTTRTRFFQRSPGSLILAELMTGWRNYRTLPVWHSFKTY